MLKLNLGCGEVRPAGWVNTDSSLNANLQRLPVVGTLVNKMFKTVKYNSNNMVYMNLNKPWSSYSDNSVDVVYASHLFEHLTLVAADLFLKESYRCLKPGGTIRVVVPDLYKICKKYISDYENNVENPSDFIMWAINMHREGQYGSKIGFVKKQILEWQGYPHQHKFMYDEKSLGRKFTNTGFKDILSLEYGISRYIPEIKDVEGDRERYLSVYLEAKKPQ
jgi:predicted SAM-dependent methyltransferase